MTLATASGHFAGIVGRKFLVAAFTMTWKSWTSSISISLIKEWKKKYQFILSQKITIWTTISFTSTLPLYSPKGRSCLPHINRWTISHNTIPILWNITKFSLIVCTIDLYPLVSFSFFSFFRSLVLTLSLCLVLLLPVDIRFWSERCTVIEFRSSISISASKFSQRG
jgi:hypothetical protein